MVVGLNQVSGVWTPYSANWYIDCPNPNASQQGFDPNAHSVTFYQGNLVFAGGISVKQASTLNINCPLTGSCTPVTGLVSATYPSACKTSDLGATCITASSKGAAWVYLRAVSNRNTQLLDTGNSGTTNIYYSSVVIESAPSTPGSLQWGAGGTTVLNWFAPIEGPFRNLALWSDGAMQHTLNGAAGIGMEGIFFAPEATPFLFGGLGDFGQTKAQFVTYDMDLSGQGKLTMSPDETRIEPIPLNGALLIR